MSEILRYVNANVNDEILSESINASNKQNMMRSLEKYGDKNASNSNYGFVNLDKKRHSFSSQNSEIIKSVSEQTLLNLRANFQLI